MPKFSKVRVGRRVRKMRGLRSQATFAKKIGISRGFLSEIENGSREMSLKTFFKFCHHANCNSAWLLGLY